MDEPPAVSPNPPPAGDPQTLAYQSQPRRARKPSGSTIRTLYVLGIVHALAGACGVLAVVAPFFHGFEIYGDWDFSRFDWLPGLPLSSLGIVGIVYWTCAHKIDHSGARGAALAALILASAQMVPVFALLLALAAEALHGDLSSLLVIVLFWGPLFACLLGAVVGLARLLGARAMFSRAEILAGRCPAFGFDR